MFLNNMGTILTGLVLLGIVTAFIFKYAGTKKNALDVPAGAGNPVQKSGIKHGILIMCIIVILCVIGAYGLALLQGELY
jgi:predicted RND superfamily exporter protein